MSYVTWERMVEITERNAAQFELDGRDAAARLMREIAAGIRKRHEGEVWRDPPGPRNERPPVLTMQDLNFDREAQTRSDWD